MRGSLRGACGGLADFAIVQSYLSTRGEPQRGDELPARIAVSVHAHHEPVAPDQHRAVLAGPLPEAPRAVSAIDLGRMLVARCPAVQLQMVTNFPSLYLQGCHSYQ